MNEANIQVEITHPAQLYCFRLVFNPQSAPDKQIQIMLEAQSLVDLIHKCSLALYDWLPTIRGRSQDRTVTELAECVSRDVTTLE